MAKKATPKAKKSGIDFSEVKIGDVFSESSHYRVLSISTAHMKLMHLESGNEVELSKGYITDLLKSAEHYSEEVKVGKEDKLWTQKQIDEAKSRGEVHATVRVGDVRVEGIRSIFEGIHSAQVFTVVFETQAKEMTNKEYEALREAQITEAIELIDKAKKLKKGVAEAAKQAIKGVQDNPINKLIKGHDSTLRGYKVQFESRDGRYNCVNLDITDAHNIRPVNINTIKELCYNGKKYIVE